MEDTTKFKLPYRGPGAKSKAAEERYEAQTQQGHWWRIRLEPAGRNVGDSRSTIARGCSALILIDR